MQQKKEFHSTKSSQNSDGGKHVIISHRMPQAHSAPKKLIENKAKHENKTVALTVANDLFSQVAIGK